ncbi:MAG: hypothetical protein LC687_00180, partial [Actinobacteria bacterium]|nr:hypothetical protein [Actinomycetota bacterium]
RDVLSEADPKTDIITEMLSAAGKFQDRLLPIAMRAFRALDVKTLQTLYTSIQKRPVVGPAEIEAAIKNPVEWAPLVYQRFNKKLGEEDTAVLIQALQQVYEEVYIAGAMGMGKGESLYMILCGGEKPDRGDLKVPGVGELELKGATGRMKGVNSRLGSIETTFEAMLQMIEDYDSGYPEIVSIMDQLPPVSPKGSSSFLNPNGTNLKRASYPLINDALGSQGRRLGFYKNLWTLYFRSLHPMNYTRLPSGTIDRVANHFANGEFEEGTVVIAGAQYHLYKEVDGFDGMMLIKPSTFLVIETMEDLIEIASLGKDKNTIVQITPGSISPGNEGGSVAGLTLL